MAVGCSVLYRYSKQGFPSLCSPCVLLDTTVVSRGSLVSGNWRLFSNTLTPQLSSFLRPLSPLQHHQIKCVPLLGLLVLYKETHNIKLCHKQLTEDCTPHTACTSCSRTCQVFTQPRLPVDCVGGGTVITGVKYCRTVRRVTTWVAGAWCPADWLTHVERMSACHTTHTTDTLNIQSAGADSRQQTADLLSSSLLCLPFPVTPADVW